MNTLHFKRTKVVTLRIPVIIMALAVISCGQEKKSAKAEPEPDVAIKIVTQGMDFQVKDSIKSGWQTFHYTNNSKEPHFFLLEKYPEGKTVEDGVKEIVPVFQKGMDLIVEGKMDDAMAAFGELPEWFPQITFHGGSGLVSPGNTAISTLYLEPGYYVIECYVKMSNGVFHSAMGMLKGLVVLQDPVDYKPPKPTVELSISKEGGIVMNGDPGVGSQVFAVNVIDQAPHEHFVGHDINLARLSENANLDSLASWMNWSDPKGLISPSPAGVTFLGGVNDMQAGKVGYFSADLEPGRYALISEVPSPAEKKMLQTFVVKPNEQP